MSAGGIEGRFKVDYPVGTVVYRQGERGEHLYVVRSGKVELTRSVGGHATTVAVVHPGDFFGEMAVIVNSPRTGTARVIERAKLLALDAATFRTMIANSSEIATRMVERLAQRLIEATRQIELLLLRDPHARVAHALRQDAELVQPNTSEAEPLPGVTIFSLAERLGMTSDEVEVVLEQMDRAGLVRIHQGLLISVVDVARLRDYVDFLEMKNRVKRDGPTAT